MVELVFIFFEMVFLNYLIEIMDSKDMKKLLFSWKIRNSFNYVMVIWVLY